MAPREVRRELEKKEDNGALSWVKANTSLLRDLDADQSSVASDLVSSPRYRDLIDLDAEFPDADPFVVALAVTCQVRSVLFTEPPAVVGIKSFRSRVSISDVCEDADYHIRFLTPYQMLREIDIDVPDPGAEGLAGLYGIWRDVDFSEEENSSIQIKDTRHTPLIYLVDTNALVWYLSGKLQNYLKLQRVWLDSPGTGNQLAVPTIVLVEAWDLARKRRREYVPLRQILRSIRSRTILLQGLTLSVVNLLPDLWQDSRDLIILATALDLKAQYGAVAIISRDRKFRFCQSLVPCIW